jgi:ATP-dependent Lon protease
MRNGPDLEDVPEAVRDEMTFHLATAVSDVLSAALAEVGSVAQRGEPGEHTQAA